MSGWKRRLSRTLANQIGEPTEDIMDDMNSTPAKDGSGT
ncbi:hypothetical protein ACVIRO_005583 [Rhizobium ruizarguesonis]